MNPIQMDNRWMCHQTNNEGNREHFTDTHVLCVSMRPTLAQLEETWGEDCWTENYKKMEPLISLKQASSLSDPNR